MAFFDQKQNVMDVVMTTYGRYLLSVGRFRPAYYAFFDNDIIYDSSYAAAASILPENQNEIEQRILSETVRSRPQTNFTGVETGIKRQIKFNKSASSSSSPGHELIAGLDKSPHDINMQHESERDFSMGMPLGKTSVSNDLPPSFRVVMLAGEIESSTETMAPNKPGSGLRIPQIEIDINYDITAHNIKKETKAELQLASRQRNKDCYFSGIFGDGTFLKMEGSHALIMLEEDNVEFDVENFEVEVFEEIRETVRVPRRLDSGEVVFEKEEQIRYSPVFFDPQSVLSETGRFYEDFEDMQTEKLGLPSEDAVGSIFSLNSDNELSVPIGLLQSAVASSEELSNRLQNNDSTYLSKPFLSIPASQISSYAAGPFSSVESDMYVRIPENLDDCEDTGGGSGYE